MDRSWRTSARVPAMLPSSWPSSPASSVRRTDSDTKTRCAGLLKYMTMWHSIRVSRWQRGCRSAADAHALAIDQRHRVRERPHQATPRLTMSIQGVAYVN